VQTAPQVNISRVIAVCDLCKAVDDMGQMQVRL
jgi:hypothetical protein